jgi:CubicO group peptidase (beta-lactamase class C family)
MRRYVDEGKLAGLITLVARRGQVVHLGRFGMMDLEAGKAMQMDTIFRIYSMTKPIASVASMMLYEEGLFLLSDPVSRFIPGFEEVKVYVDETESGLELADPEREMTIWHLLTHTSGLVYGNPEGTPVEKLVWQADREAEKSSSDESLEEWVERLVKLPLAHQSGSAWHYGLSTDVLGYLVEVVSGMSLDTFLERRIFEPLGMVDTGFYVPQSKVDRLAANYGPGEGGGIVVIDAPATSVFAKPRRFLSGGGGLVSTIYDYLRFAQMLLNGGTLDGTRLLGRKAIELMTINHLPAHMHPFEDPAVGFGLGVSVLVDVARSRSLGSVGRYGWGGAASTTFRIDPQEELIYILMTQFMPNGHYPIADEFPVLVYQAIVD